MKIRRGTISLVFDDGYEDVYHYVLPLLRKHRLHATFAVPVRTENLSKVMHAPLMPFDAWKEACRQDGHELAAHGMTHRALPSLTDMELEKELLESRQATGATTLVYPGGAVDDRLIHIASRYFRAGRTTRWGTESVPPERPMQLRTLNATRRNFRWWKFRTRELATVMNNHWMIETFHQVTPSPTDLHDVSLKDFVRHIEWLKQLPLRIATIRDVLHELTG